MDSFLCQMISKIEECQLLVEHECSLLSKLLKPWSQSNPVEVEEAINQESKNNNVNENKRECDLSQSDLLALEEANQLLSKARWTRESKSKKSSKDRCITSVQSDTFSPVQKPSSKAASIEKLDECGVSQEVTNVSGREKIFHKVKKKAGEGCTTKLNSLTKTQPVHPSSHTSRKITPRPSSATSSRPTSRKNDYVPAHVKAPFKTDVNARVPNRRFNHLKKNQYTKKLGDNLSAVPKVQQSHPLEATAFKTLPGIKMQSKTKEQNTSAEHERVMIFHERDSPETSETICQVPESFEQATQLSEQTVESFKEAAQCEQAMHSFEQAIESFSEQRPVAISSKQNPCLEVNDSRKQIEQKTTSLKDHSCDLKIPSKLKRLYTLNNSLLKQCQDAKICKKVSNIDPAERFVERLKSQTEVCEELWIRERALICLKAHDLMHEILQSLDLDKLTESSSYQKIFRTKKRLEFVLFMFGKLQDEADYFTQVQFRPMDSLVLDRSENNSPFNWFENLIEKVSETQDRMLQGELECTREWMHLKFMERYYQLQQHLLSLAEKEWWHLVSSDSSELSLIQLVHSLMTTNGEHVPAVVSDVTSYQ